MKIRMTRQAFPRCGGAVLAAGNIYDLSRDVVRQLPKGSYRRVKKAPHFPPVTLHPTKVEAPWAGGNQETLPAKGKQKPPPAGKQQTPPADKQQTGGKKKQEAPGTGH